MRRIGKEEALGLVERSSGPAAAHGGCVMCALVAGSYADVDGAPCAAGAIAENEAAILLLERFAIRRGHLVVVLRRHVERVAELGWAEYALVQRLVWQAARVLEAVLSPSRVFVAALGSASRRGNSFPHHHVHVVPLYDGGDIDRPAEVFTWSSGVFVYEDPSEARALEAELRAAF